MMDKFNLRRNLPLAGIVAFAMCSVWSVYQLLVSFAKHDTWLFWIPAVLVEIVSAWAAYNVVLMARWILKTHLTNQDRKFYRTMLFLFTLVAAPTLAVSVVANTMEFSGNVLLGFLFPVACVGCAIGVALPDAEEEFRRARAEEKAEEKAEKERRKREKRENEARRAEMEASLACVGASALEVLRQFAANPRQSQADVAEVLGVNRRTVSYHMEKLSSEGLMERQNGAWRVLIDGEMLQ